MWLPFPLDCDTKSSTCCRLPATTSTPPLGGGTPPPTTGPATVTDVWPPAVAKATATGDPDPMLVLLLLLPVDPMLNLLAGHPYLLLLRWRSISHRRLKAFPHEGHLWVPRWICRWCCNEPGCLKILPHSSQVYRPIPSGAMEKALATESGKWKIDKWLV